MRIRTKISVILLVIWAVMTLATYCGSQFILKQSYLKLEQRSSEQNMTRLHLAIGQMVATLDSMVANWSVWDDTYRFVVDNNEAYKKTNLVVSSFTSADIDLMLFFNTTGKPVFTMAVNADKTKETPLPPSLMNDLTPASKLVNLPNVNDDISGLLSIPSGILIISAHPILTSNNRGPAHGTLIMAKYLTNAALERVKNITQVNVSLYTLQAVAQDPHLNSLYHLLASGDNFQLERINTSTLNAYTLLTDINNQPIALLKAKMPRRLYQIGLQTIYFYNIIFIIYSIILVIILWNFLQSLIVKRLEKLKTQILEVDSNNKLFLDLIEGVSDEVSSVASLYHHATHDPLTGLANRNLLYQAFNKHLQHLSEPQNKIAILFIDIDHFKRVNDSLGHEVGDQLLIALAKQLNACLRDHDLAVRLGGDEFVAMLVGVDDKQVERIVLRIHQSLNNPVIIKGHELYLTSCIGISLYPTDGNDITTLIKNADIALYYAKENGRNRYQYYSGELDRAILEANRKEVELQQALDQNQLCLYYQPIYDALTGRIISVEALLRWQHPEKGLLAASEIIPIAERTGLIVPIGIWIMRAACEQIKIWQKKGVPTTPLSVNISVLQTKHASLRELVVNALEESGISPSLLELELTETGYVEITPQILEELRSLRAMGIELAVDDFGIGYSGLGYLKSLPISKLKIDQSFIRDLPNSPDNRAIILAIVAIAHQLNLKVIAEGVENNEQYQYLKDNHVDAVQGRFFNPPMDAGRCEALLKATDAPVGSL